MKVLLVCPATPETFWSFKHVLRFVSKRAAFPAAGPVDRGRDAACRLAAQAGGPERERLTDDDLRWADYVMISAMIIAQGIGGRHRESLPRLAVKPIIAGGPLFTTGHAAFPEIGHFVLGEAEEFMPQVVDDMRRGAVRQHVRRIEPARHHSRAFAALGSDRPSQLCHDVGPVLAGLPVRLRVLRYHRHERCASRGPNHRPNWSPSSKTFASRLAGHGFRRRRQLYRQQAAGQSVAPGTHRNGERRTGAKMGFLTEASANLADDAELCDLMVAAGFKKVLRGFETPSLESLKECRKLQNCSRDLVETVKTLQRAGLEVMGGFIVGFDNDPSGHLQTPVRVHPTLSASSRPWWGS